MRQRRNLYAIVLTFGVALATLGLLRGQSPAWTPPGGEPPPAQPQVIASSKTTPATNLLPDLRLTLPDDGLSGKPSPTAPTSTARPAPVVSEIQRTNYVSAPTPDFDRSMPPAGAAVSVEARGPTTASPQQKYTAVVLVRNFGREAVGQVRVELPIPAGARVVNCDPQAELPGDRVIWILGSLDPGAVRKMSVELLPVELGEIHLRPRVTYEASAGLRTEIVRPPFVVALSGPLTASIGDPVVLSVQIGNHTSEAMRLVQVQVVLLPPGLYHSEGDKIITEVPNGLVAGEVRTLDLRVEARGSGRLTAQVSAVADNKYSGATQHSVSVNEPALTVHVDGSRRATLGHDSEYSVEIANPGKVAARDVRLSLALPQGVGFVKASSGGLFDPGLQAIQWSVAELQGGQRQTVTFQLKPTQAGDWALPATLNAEAMQEVRATHSVHVDVTPVLAVEATAEANPLDLGRETTYEVRVINQGAATATGVALTVRLPDLMTAISQEGPTHAAANGPLLVFDSIELKGRAAAVYKVKVRGQRSGQGALRLEVLAAGLAAPVVREVTANVRGTTVAGLGR